MLLLLALFLAADPQRVAFDSAAAALANGDYGRAERGFLAVLKAEPRNVGALGNLGVVYSRTWRPRKAIEVYSRALKIAPGDPALLLNLGLAYARAERHGEAIGAYRAVLRRKPRHTQTLQLLAASQLASGDAAGALSTLEGLDREPGALYLRGMAHLKQHRPDAAREAFAGMLANSSPARTEYLVGKAYYESKLFEEAEEAFAAARRLDPDLPGLRLELGKLYISQRRTEEAIAELRAALKHDPGNADANYYLGALLARERRCSEAVPHLDAARRSAGDSWGALYYQGRCRLEAGDGEGASKLLARAAELNPEDATVYYLFGRALRAAGRDEEARAAMSQVRRLRTGALQEEIDIISGRKGSAATAGITEGITPP